MSIVNFIPNWKWYKSEIELEIMCAAKNIFYGLKYRNFQKIENFENSLKQKVRMLSWIGLTKKKLPFLTFMIICIAVAGFCNQQFLQKGLHIQWGYSYTVVGCAVIDI